MGGERDILLGLGVGADVLEEPCALLHVFQGRDALGTPLAETPVHQRHTVL